MRSGEPEDLLRQLASALVDQEGASILISPHRAQPGFWFGGGSLAQDREGAIWLSGRYRNAGDSRTGLRAGERGLECALFRSADGGQSFEKAIGWSKADLSRPGREVLSIEGSALYRREDGIWELYVSSEKALSYPSAVQSYQKPGTGVWTIDRVTGRSPETLDPQTLASVLENETRPEYLHVKDPVVFGGEGQTWMVFCSHPYSWSSGNTGLAMQPRGESAYRVTRWEVVSRGATWDVAATRVTDRLPVPSVGAFADRPPCSIYFYDGAECLRPHEENPLAHRRPRGYSCEELGGAMWGWDRTFPEIERLSVLAPFFVSPWGTGASRYVSTLATERGILTTWEQSQPDGSQPLVGKWTEMAEVEHILSGGR